MKGFETERLTCGGLLTENWQDSVPSGHFHRCLRGSKISRKELCEVAGVQWHAVPASYTSRTCPECGYQDGGNRDGEHFRCLRCGYEDDADIVGIRNVLLRLTGESIVPLPAKPCPVEEISIG